jgi:putative ABC transport system permease protein
LVAILTAAFLGSVAGFITSCIISRVKIEPVLAGIITLIAMQTFIVKLASFEKLKTAHTFLTALPAFQTFLIVAAITLVAAFLFYRLLHSEYGLAMRVYGDGVIISESLGIDSKRMLWLGLGIGNALSALAGALIAQISRDFSAGMGGGALVFGLAATIIGGKLVSAKGVRATIIGCFVGSVIYKTVLGVAIFLFGGSKTSEYDGLVTSLALLILMTSLNDSKKIREMLHD